MFRHRRFLLLLVGTAPAFPGYGQVAPAARPGVVCTYRLVYAPDSTAAGSRSELFSLVIASGQSLFRSKPAIAMDSLADVYKDRPFNEQNAQLMMQDFSKLPKAAFSYSIYKQPAEHSVTLYEKIGKVLYSYQEPASLLAWAITSSTATIAGYQCQQATTYLGGRKFEA